MKIFWGYHASFHRNSAGSSLCIFREEGIKAMDPESLSGICLRCYGGGFCVVAPDPGYGYERGHGEIFHGSGSGWFLLGIGFLLLMDKAVPHLHMGSEESEGYAGGFKKQLCLSLR